jgi:hypothetical protein
LLTIACASNQRQGEPTDSATDTNYDHFGDIDTLSFALIGQQTFAAHYQSLGIFCDDQLNWVDTSMIVDAAEIDSQIVPVVNYNFEWSELELYLEDCEEANWEVRFQIWASRDTDVTADESLWNYTTTEEFDTINSLDVCADPNYYLLGSGDAQTPARNVLWPTMASKAWLKQYGGNADKIVPDQQFETGVAKDASDHDACFDARELEAWDVVNETMFELN